MFCYNDPYIKQHFFDGNFGLEKEMLRIKTDGSLSHTPHPFPKGNGITRDFCENQLEINTGVHDSIAGAVEEICLIQDRIRETLDDLPEPELLWPSSNPAYIKSVEDIPIAQFDGKDAAKTKYRQYLAAKYGRYKMTFSGIHFNFSFADEVLLRCMELGKEQDERAFKDRLYVRLAAGLMEYGWILIALTAASPLFDNSFFEKGKSKETIFSGMSSVRCSETGYWNEFVPVLDYTDLDAYADSITAYIGSGLLTAPSELYYPIRIKPSGENTPKRLKEFGADHIELRMFDLNPLTKCGIDERDLFFSQLLILWVAATYRGRPCANDQIRSIGNFKRAAHYDLRTVRILKNDGNHQDSVDAGLEILGKMSAFYQGFPEKVTAALDFQKKKFEDAENRYAWIIRKKYRDGFVEKTLKELKNRKSR